MVPIVVLGLPIFDTTMVTFARLLARRPVSQGGTDHTSHRLARLGLGINRAVMTMYLARRGAWDPGHPDDPIHARDRDRLFAGLLAVGVVRCWSWNARGRFRPPIRWLSSWRRTIRRARRSARRGGFPPISRWWPRRGRKPADAARLPSGTGRRRRKHFRGGWIPEADEAVGPAEMWNELYRLAAGFKSRPAHPERMP